MGCPRGIASVGRLGLVTHDDPVELQWGAVSGAGAGNHWHTIDQVLTEEASSSDRPLRMEAEARGQWFPGSDSVNVHSAHNSMYPESEIALLLFARVGGPASRAWLRTSGDEHRSSSAQPARSP